MATTRTTPLVPTGTWAADPAHSSVEFAVKHMGIATVRGRFTDYDGSMEIGQDLSSSRAQGQVRVASIDTGEADRDAHLRGPDFFDADQYPVMTFESTRIEPVDEDSSRVFGNLTMHGVTREVKLEVVIAGTDTDPWGNERVGLEIVGVIRRSDFDMKFNQALGSGNMMVGDKVSLALDISAIRQA
jgi:polyisoprenoid-binding protein YceI